MGWRYQPSVGYLIHPVQAAFVLYPLFFRWLNNLRLHWPGAFRYCMGQYLLWLGSWGFFSGWTGRGP